MKLEEIREKKQLLLNKRQILQDEFEYYDQFNFTEDLGKAICFLIKEFEGKDCICKKIVCDVSEHYEYVERFFDGENHRLPKRFTKKNYAFVVVFEKNNFENFENLSFKTFNDMKDKLISNSLFISAYLGTLDLEMFEHAFPYLQHFFYILNQWRTESGRVTLDNDIINQALVTVVNEEFFSKNNKHKI